MSLWPNVVLWEISYQVIMCFNIWPKWQISHTCVGRLAGIMDGMHYSNYFVACFKRVWICTFPWGNILTICHVLPCWICYECYKDYRLKHELFVQIIAFILTWLCPDYSIHFNLTALVTVSACQKEGLTHWIGRGDKASFWHSSWLYGRAPIDIAPNLYPLAWRKNQKVKDDLLHMNWTRGLWRMDSVQQSGHIVMQNLDILLHDLNLNDKLNWAAPKREQGQGQL
jgi:hypothetical protein